MCAPPPTLPSPQSISAAAPPGLECSVGFSLVCSKVCLVSSKASISAAAPSGLNWVLVWGLA
jgi:hypothetical protein